MIVGVLELKISIFDAMTLKDKRRVVKSLKDRIHNTFNASVAEVEGQDLIRTAVLGVAVVANDGRFVESVLSKIVDLVRRTPPVSLIDYQIEKL